MDRYKILTLLVFITLLISAFNINGQQNNKKNVIDTLHASDFNKVPVTFLYRCNNEDYAKIMSDIIDSLYECEGIIKNDIDVKRIGYEKDNPANSYKISAAHYLKDELYANNIIYACVNCDNKGIFDFNKIRKKLGLKEGELAIPNSNFSSLDILKNAGELLVNNSYILVFDLFEANKPEKSPTEKLKSKHSYTISAYLYKIDFNHDMATYFYRDLTLDNEDVISQNLDMANKFDQHSLKISIIKRYDLRRQTIEINNTNRYHTLEKTIKNSVDKLISKIYIIPEGAKNKFGLISNIAAFTPDLKYVKCSSPENTYIDQKYDVYALTEKNIWTRNIESRDYGSRGYKDKVSTLKKVAEIELKKASGNNDSLYEYIHTAGIKLDNNYLLKSKKNILGLGLSVGYGFSLLHKCKQDQSAAAFGNGGFPFIRADLNLSRIFSKYLDITMPSSINIFFEGNYANYLYNKTFQISKTATKFGLSKDFHFRKDDYYTFFIGYGNTSSNYKKTIINEIPMRIYADSYFFKGYNEDGAYVTHEVHDKDKLLKQSELLYGIRYSIILSYNIHFQYSIEGSLINNSWQFNFQPNLAEMNFMEKYDLKMNLGLQYQF